MLDSLVENYKQRTNNTIIQHFLQRLIRYNKLINKNFLLLSIAMHAIPSSIIGALKNIFIFGRSLKSCDATLFYSVQFFNLYYNTKSI